MTRVIAIVFDGAQALDLIGPTSVFAAARAGERAAYEIVYASLAGGTRTVTSGLGIETRELARIRARATDLVLVPGGDEPALLATVADAALVRWLQRAAKTVRRLASVCSGAFLLAYAGLLDGKPATTHWRVCERLAHDFPRVRVDANAIYVHSGRIWTSAGVTTGIDMALAMVEQDLGRSEVDRLAKELVMYVRRPGFQSQFSAALVAQTASSAELSAALEWARAHLAQASVETLAKRACVSVRTLHRLCRDQLDTTPAKLLERLRVEQARVLLSTGARSLKSLAATCGFDNSTRMKRAFVRELGMGPREYRHLHGSVGPAGMK